MPDTDIMTRSIVVIGGGPAGLMAAEAASGHGFKVEVYDSMASVGRKFLLAGKGGLNLTHAEPREAFLSRYGSRQTRLQPVIEAFGPEVLRDWAWDLGVPTFTGSSKRVFPVDQKAAPLLRSWLRRLRKAGVVFHVNHRWLGWNEAGALRFATPHGERPVSAEAVVLAMGGGSWARLGSDGAWVPLLADRGVEVAELRPSNCGFDVDWSEHFRNRHAGQPIKTVAANTPEGPRLGEFVITGHGVEGHLIYALSPSLRDGLADRGEAVLQLDLAPGRDARKLAADLAKPRGSASWSKHLRRQAGLEGAKAGLLRELATEEELADPERLAAAIKSLPLKLLAPRPIDEAISSAGGVAFEDLDENLMIRKLPGVFCAGEMLDWEAPTGGYLLTACFATGRTAGAGAARWLAECRARNYTADLQG